MRALVTGGAGFIGSNLVDFLLAKGLHVAVVDNLTTGKLSNLSSASRSQRFEFMNGDITSLEIPEFIASYRPDLVFHMAAQADVRASVVDPVLDASVNIIGTLRVIDGAIRGGAKKIIAAASGGTLYGEVSDEELPISEDMPWRPLSPYGISKKSMIDYLRFAQVTHGIETTALALGNVFGPRQDPHGEAGVISIFLQQYLSGNRTTIFGSGLQTRDFIYVGDVVQAFARAAEQTGEGLLLNIGTGIETSVNDLIQLMNAVTKKTIVPKYEPARLGELDRSVLDSRRAKEWMNWSSSVDVRSGLEATWEWIRHGAT